jgi:glycogen operon protein
LKSRDYSIDDRPGNSGYPELSWHGTKAWEADFSGSSRCIGVMFCGKSESIGGKDDFIYVAMNSHWESHDFELPQLPQDLKWHVFANTDMPAGQDICNLGEEVLLDNQYAITVGPRAIVVLVAK